jgi:hypothetical protein
MAAAAMPRSERDCITAFKHTFPDTEFLEPSEICSCFEINDVWELSEKASHHDVQTVVASFGLHSTLILFPTPDPERNPGVYYANLEYERVDENVTRITSTDLVPQHAYYYLVMKIYELFLHPDASERIFNQDIARFITQELNSGLVDGREFFEERVKKFFESNPEFLKHTDPEELQTSIAAVWDILRSDKFKLAGSTVQKFFISTVGFDDPEKYELKSQGTVTKDASEAFHKTVYGFHVLVYINGHAISMSLSRAKLFSRYSFSDKKQVFSFFNSEMIKYMASPDFMDLVRGIIEGPGSTLLSTKMPEVERLKVGEKQKLFAFECGCKSPIIGGYDRDGKLTLTYQTKRPDHREHIVGMDHKRKHYIFVNNYPSLGSLDTRLFVTCSPEFNRLPNFCKYENIKAVNRVLGIEYGDNGVDSMGGVNGDSPPRMPGSHEQEEHSRIVQAALVHASNGAPNVVVPEKAEYVASSKEEMDERGVGAAAAPAGTPSNPGMSSGRFFGKVMSGLGTACNFIRSIFGYSTPTCSAGGGVNIEYLGSAVFCVPTQEEDKKGILIKKKLRTRPMTMLSWPEARALWLGEVVGMEEGEGEVGMSADLGGGRRPVSRKYRNNKKNISRKKGKKRMSLRHRRSRRRLRRRSHSLCLKKLK